MQIPSLNPLILRVFLQKVLFGPVVRAGVFCRSRPCDHILSVFEAIGDILRRCQARIALSKDPASVLRDHIIDGVTHARGHYGQNGQERPRTSQPPQNLQHRRRLEIGRSILNKYDCIQPLVLAMIITPQQFAEFRLQRNESKGTARVVPDNKIHEAAAQVADTVEQDDRLRIFTVHE
jgi:hypothetical protein